MRSIRTSKLYLPNTHDRQMERERKLDIYFTYYYYMHNVMNGLFKFSRIVYANERSATHSYPYALVNWVLVSIKRNKNSFGFSSYPYSKYIYISACPWVCANRLICICERAHSIRTHTSLSLCVSVCAKRRFDIKLTRFGLYV